MEIKFILNGKPVTASIDADMTLLNLVREKGCYSVNLVVKQRTAVCVLCG